MNYLSLLSLVLFINIAHGTIQPRLSNLRDVSTDYDVFPFEIKESNELSYGHIVGQYNSTGRDYSAYYAVFSPNYFSFYPPTTKGCNQLIKPSISSKARGCAYATNGAFFQWSGESLCIGNLISDGYTWQLPTDGSGTGRANFGITGDNEIIIGFIDSDVISYTNFTQLITGWGWLVRDGKSNVDLSGDLTNTGFNEEKAPRTAIGLFSNGSLILLEIDGEEDIFAGPDLYETAELLVNLGVESAINLDGGGSSVSVVDGVVIDQPTCNDTPEICERADASIACVRK
mmetsp:Transcript_11314/g.10231  ORF Transcript_11314/g.10231 Transcript_11314/m.10231 type:complete len:287 (-) Transcript_11314:175-1035(-)|eukprot:CAMPEP_0196762328 /NCGR_PEP_ID=MMETSP1095-20130614/1737_1 /TAXON_ID=96789 ORGANISM="Chromulina nebulosa, Strain UTEXLB2642" /NCGR_SAMPLE_ID=MMETSP1095 /ASSEMBLY_ACC=CAM_ASM_000446 /LENGTH=286 /DNA_ID=CAMNT_0042112969 /DNA_START=15 /DNA_END=875 /DNA_ORIENTATION=+